MPTDQPGASLNDAEVEELLDEESIAVLGILLAVALECGFAFAKLVAWWAGIAAAPIALALLITVLKLRASRRLVVRLARWVVRPPSAAQ